MTGVPDYEGSRESDNEKKHRMYVPVTRKLKKCGLLYWNTFAFYILSNYFNIVSVIKYEEVIYDFLYLL